MTPNDKFIWEKGDLKIMTEEEFRSQVNTHCDAPKNTYPLCPRNSFCAGCSSKRHEQAQQLAQRIFLGYFATPKADETLFRRVMQGLTGILQKLCAGKCVLTKELYHCTKTILVTMVMEKTRISVTDQMLDTLFPQES